MNYQTTLHRQEEDAYLLYPCSQPRHCTFQFTNPIQIAATNLQIQMDYKSAEEANFIEQIQTAKIGNQNEQMYIILSTQKEKKTEQLLFSYRRSCEINILSVQ